MVHLFFFQILFLSDCSTNPLFCATGIHSTDPTLVVAADWVCNGCGGSFARKDSLVRHKRTRNCGSM